MKTTLSIIVIIAILIGGLNRLNAQTVQQISIDAKGGVHNHKGTILGFIGKDNIVRNTKGQTIYFIDKSGNVTDATGKKIGKAEKSGNFYNTEGVSVLTVKDKGAENCQILDPKGHNLGVVHKNYKLHACAAHCFNMKKKLSKQK